MRTTRKCKRCYDKNLLKECACGCGGILSERDSNSRFRSFIQGHHSKLEKYKHRISPKGEDHYNWKGGRSLSRGYVMIRTEDHPKAKQSNRYRIAEHVLTMERKLDRYLRDDEVVHHINGIRHDNRIDNLQLTTYSKHANIHHPKGEKRTEFWKRYIIVRDKQTGRIVSVSLRQ